MRSHKGRKILNKYEPSRVPCRSLTTTMFMDDQRDEVGFEEFAEGLLAGKFYSSMII